MMMALAGSLAMATLMLAVVNSLAIIRNSSRATIVLTILMIACGLGGVVALEFS